MDRRRLNWRWAVAMLLAVNCAAPSAVAEEAATDSNAEAPTTNAVRRVGKPILRDDTFCGFSFAEKRTGKPTSRKVRDAYGFESVPRTKLKKPFRGFKEAILTYSEHGYLQNVSLVRVLSKVKQKKEIEAAAKEFTEVVLVIAKKYQMDPVDGSYERSGLERKGSREVLDCRDFDSPTSHYRIQVAVEAWTCVRERAALRGTAPLPSREDNFLVLIVSVDNKRVAELEREERFKAYNLEGGDAL